MTQMLNQTAVDKIESALASFAAQWRGCKDQVMKNAIAQQYGALLSLLMEWGWRGALPPDCELPDEFMPRCYVEYFEARLRERRDVISAMVEQDRDMLERLSKTGWCRPKE